MRVTRIMVLGFLAAAMAEASAQPVRTPVESVIVTGTRAPEEKIRGFVQSFAAPTRLTGKIARWESGICPVTVGLPAAFTKFVTQRVRDVAAQVGAPVNGSESCEHNIAIVFTAKPQALLDNVRKNQSWMLGYTDNSAQADKLAMVTHPIQAWYRTATKDLNGKVDIDSSKMLGPGLEIRVPCPTGPGICSVYLPNARVEAVTGSRLGDGLRSNFYNVIIVADPGKLADHEIGSLADYIALLALTQLNALDTCQQLPSIVNMLAPGCDNKAETLTDSDTAYLRGLYKMSPDRTARTQQDEIAYQMGQVLGAGK